jgi:glycosyltransferase involved in cell wall biosynthesis
VEHLEKVAILAAYNLENSMGELIQRVQKFVDLVIVVSDGSTDNTNLKAVEAGAICPPHSDKKGKGFAVRKGIKFSKQFKPKYIILMDADGQHLPEEIPVILKPLKKNKADMVVGSRIKGKLKTSGINKIGNFCLKLISFIVTGKWMSDTESGFRGFKAEKLYKINLESTNYEIESELLLKFLHNRFRVLEVPITVPKAVPGITVYGGMMNGWYKIREGIKLKIKK